MPLTSNAARLVFYPLNARACRRRGVTLVELVVAMFLGALVIAMGANALVGQRRAERRTAAALAPSVAADEAIYAVVASLNRVAAADTVLARGDTAVEWRATIGAALACAAGGDSIVVPDSGAAAWWESPPDSGDIVAFAAPSGVWDRHVIVAVHTRTAGGTCATAQRTLRLRDALLTGGVGPVRVMRTNRMMLYRASDGAWWLGERSCDSEPPVHCSAAQPVAGPLAAPPSGLRFLFDSALGPLRIGVQLVAGGVARTASVTVRQ